MAVDMFLKIGDIKGESLDHKDKESIDVLSWSWGMTQSATSHQGPGGGGGKVSIQDITVTKYIDAATPNLMKFCCNGKPFKDATLTVRKAGGKAPVEYVVIKLADVIIAAVNTGGSGG